MAIVVLEFVSLLWSHPILTGLLILLFTTPLFHIVLFFTPLLMSTALCVIALISIGPQIEKIREERQFKMSLNARALAVERPVNRYIVIRQGRPQRPGGGGRRWADWVKGIEIHGHTVWLSESHLMRDVAEEGLKSDFSHEDGGILMAGEDFPSKHKGAFSLEAGSGGTVNVEPPELDEPGAGLLVEDHQLDRDEEESGLNGENDEQKACVNEDGGVTNMDVVVSVEDNAGLKQTVHGDGTRDGVYWPEKNRVLDLIPVESASVPVCLFAPGDTTFGFGVSTPVPMKAKRKKKRSSWFGRRRIPCLSKALGQLREKICNQIRRIFS